MHPSQGVSLRANRSLLWTHLHAPLVLERFLCHTLLPTSGLQTNAAMYQHTTHKPGPAKIAYRFHPFFEQDAQIIRKLRSQVEPSVIVQLDDGLRIAIPCWMLDSTVCDSMLLEKCPVVSIDSLLALGDFIDVQTQAIMGTPHENQNTTSAGVAVEPTATDL